MFIYIRCLVADVIDIQIEEQNVAQKVKKKEIRNEEQQKWSVEKPTHKNLLLMAWGATNK